MTRFLLIRHGTTDSVGKRLAGRMAGVSLNEEGRQQAQKLAEQIARLPIAAIYSSPLDRAIETAQPISKLLHLQTIICEDFLEMDFGEWTNNTIEELNNDVQFQQFNSFRSCSGIPGGESMLEAQARMIKGLSKLFNTYQNETVVIISHSDLIKATVAYYAGIHLDLFHRLEISPASVSIIEIHDDTARILLVNHTGEIMI